MKPGEEGFALIKDTFSHKQALLNREPNNEVDSTGGTGNAE